MGTILRCFDHGTSNRVSIRLCRIGGKTQINRGCELSEACLLREYVTVGGLAPSYVVRLTFATVHRIPGDKMDVSLPEKHY